MNNELNEQQKVKLKQIFEQGLLRFGPGPLQAMVTELMSDKKVK
jgi:hypothetical protein